MNRFVTIALCVAAVGSMSAQKAVVDQAGKLAGKIDQLGNARNLIKQAIENPETAQDARTYFTAGKIEFDAFDKAEVNKAINPSDPSAQPEVMGEELLNGYKYFLKALPLDSVPDEKGKIKPKYSKDIYSKIAGHANNFFGVGADYFNAKKYYPEAYEAFMIYGDLPSSGMLGKAAALIPEEQIATSYFNAGLAAYQGNAVEESANAFKKARQAGYDKDEAYIYEIACWQNLAQKDEARAAESQQKIMEVAQAGYDKFGMEQPIFFNNIVNSLVLDGKTQEALSKLDAAISANPDNAGLYGLRGYVYDRAEDDEKSEADYRKAASIPNVDFETLKNASKKIFRIGTTKWDKIEGNSDEAKAARQNVKTNYFDVSKKIADQAKGMNPTDGDLQSLMESIDYVLTTYF